jgi:hypothetical protein
MKTPNPLVNAEMEMWASEPDRQMLVTHWLEPEILVGTFQTQHVDRLAKSTRLKQYLWLARATLRFVRVEMSELSRLRRERGLGTLAGSSALGLAKR